MRFVFRPWRRFTADIMDGAGLQGVLDTVGSFAVGKLRAGLNSSSKSGRLYKYRGTSHRASAPGEYPARRTGRLAGTVRVSRGALSFTFGTSTHYAGYLRTGTKKMKRRSMSDTALKGSYRTVRLRFSRFAKFRPL